MRLAAAASILCLLTPASCLYADSILSTYCRIGFPDGSEIAVNSTGECSLVGSEPVNPSVAQALALTNFWFLSGDSEVPDGTFVAFAGARTHATHGPYSIDYPLPDVYSTAQAYAELTLTATTAGPVRPGLIDLFSLEDVEGVGHHDYYLQTMIGSLFGEVQYENCGGACYGTYPFTLGQPFDIRVIAFAQSWGDSNGGGGHHTDLYVRFKLRELDGTPVGLLVNSEPTTPVPEPSTLLLLSSALFLLLTRSVVRRSRKISRS